jgi:hypothetical protein
MTPSDFTSAAARAAEVVLKARAAIEGPLEAEVLRQNMMRRSQLKQTVQQGISRRKDEDIREFS